MIDFHTHILPGIDDGSRSVEMTMELLEREKKQGVEQVVATPHFYASHHSISHFLENRENSYQKIVSILAERPDLPQLRLGAEVYYFPGMGKAEQLSELCIQGTNLLLLEMPFAQWTETIYMDVKEMIQKRHLQIMLAHIERFYSFQKKKDVWNDIFALPVIAQINTGSLRTFWKRRFDLHFIKTSDVPVVLGSDCHNLETRVPNLNEGRQKIADKLGQQKLQQIDDFGAKLLS